MTASHHLHLIHIQINKKTEINQEKKDMRQHEILHLPCHIKTNSVYGKRSILHLQITCIQFIYKRMKTLKSDNLL